jgi:hypothetical protein
MYLILIATGLTLACIALIGVFFTAGMSHVLSWVQRPRKATETPRMSMTLRLRRKLINRLFSSDPSEPEQSPANRASRPSGPHRAKDSRVD